MYRLLTFLRARLGADDYRAARELLLDCIDAQALELREDAEAAADKRVEAEQADLMERLATSEKTADGWLAERARQTLGDEHEGAGSLLGDLRCALDVIDSRTLQVHMLSAEAKKERALREAGGRLTPEQQAELLTGRWAQAT